MPRTSAIRYYPSRKAYYTKYKGVQHLLAAGPKDEPDGPTYKAAARRFGCIVTGIASPDSDDAPDVGYVIARYVFRLKQKGDGDAQRTRTYKNVRSILASAAATLGRMKASHLRAKDVYDWLDAQKGWGTTTRATAASQLQAALNGAVAEGTLAVNPVGTLPDVAAAIPRGAGYVLPDALLETLLAEAAPQLGHILRFMAGTGCRPGEAQNAKGKHYKPDAHAIIFPANPAPGEWRWKCAKGKRNRIIFLSPEMERLVAERVAERPDGPLFINRLGNVWTTAALAYRLDRLRRRPAVAQWCKVNRFDSGNLVPYAFRHTYITRALEKGCPVKVLADLCGTSVKMIERHYGHVHDDLPAMYRLFLLYSARQPFQQTHAESR